MEEDALKLQAQATAQALGEVAQGQQVLRERMKQLEVQLRSAWLGHAHPEFEALKVKCSQPWGVETLTHNQTSFLKLVSQRPPRSAF